MLCQHGGVFRSFLERITRADGTSGARTSGPPTSTNGASSFHLFWDVPPRPLRAVEAVIEVLEPPAVEHLYFWALQVSVSGPSGRSGGAHFGLQYHPAHPGGGAVNWGGYRQDGNELDGTASTLPSALDNVNTRDYRWEPGRRYRYRIAAAPDDGSGWRGSITDVGTGAETVVRDLYIPGDELVQPMVWTEAFCHCDHPPAAVRWSDLVAETDGGERFEVSTVRLNYQTHADGGCANTDTSVDGAGPGGGFVQRTGVERRASTGTTLRLPAR